MENLQKVNQRQQIILRSSHEMQTLNLKFEELQGKKKTKKDKVAKGP